MVGGLLNHNEFGVAEKDVWVSSFIKQYKESHPVENFKFALSDNIIHNQDLPAVEEIYDNNGDIVDFRVIGGEYIFREGDAYDTYAIDINRDDFSQIFDNIVSNARKYGFTDKNHQDYTISIDIEKGSLVNGKETITMSIRNNGNPLAADLKPKDVFKWSIGNGEGIGGAQVKDIVEHFGGSVELVQDMTREDGFYVEYRLTFPISKSNIVLTL
ncbi:MAG: ATP-binding protein [Rikenellaceae bacterium]